jgi:hypothetical protein
VHSFDLVLPSEHLRELSNVTLHTGDGHELLPKLLSGLADAGRNVDFALVDGDHSAEGVRRDMEDLLDSPAVGNTVIVVHDTMNETVRAGLEEVSYDGYPKVAYVDLDFVAGYMFREPSLEHELWGGLGLVVVDSSRGAYFSRGVRQERYHPAFDLMTRARNIIVAAGGDPDGTSEELLQLRQELDQARGWLRDMQGSLSWRITEPLRVAKRGLLRAGR